MRILITNDDGVEAPGLQALKKIASVLSDDVWIVAPEVEQSGAAHSLSLRKPLYIRQLGEKHFAVGGTPTDCVLLAVKEIMKESRPDLVLSGVNRGSNLGEDVTYSGTVAAAMEGTLFDIRSIALSQMLQRDGEVSFAVAEHYGAKLIADVLAAGIPYNTLININFPDRAIGEVRGVKVAPQGKRKLGDNLNRQQDTEGKTYYWIGNMRNCDKDPPQSDLAAVRGGSIAVTPIYLDFTHYAVIAQLDEDLTTEF